jgi:neopullulanase
MHTPDWVKHAVFYQIFPDRFARSGEVEHQEAVQLKPWGTPPEEQGFQGGDLYGVINRLDYLDELGVTALYLNPIFASAANHRYHTYDYYEVDPLLGGDEALRALLDAAHARDMRVVLDGVFNHASRGFWPLHHVLENGKDSPYVDWFVIHDWPLRPYASDPDTSHNYAAWAGIPALPEFDTTTPEVRSFLFDVARHWIEFGIDGWRLDVPAEIEAEGFWEEFREVVKGANPEAYLVGELWGEAPSWLQGDRFDGVMNYPLLGPTLSFFGAGSLRDYSKAHLTFEPLDAPAFADEIEHLLALYDWEATCAQLNLLDSHDMARAQWILGGHVAALRQAVLFLMTMPGAPCIYYGDEIGLSAAGDPHCREAFPWDKQEDWEADLLSFYQAATALRHRHEVLRTGRVEILRATGQTLVVRRTLEDQTAIVAFNAGSTAATIETAASGGPEAALSPAWPPTDAADATLDRASTVRIPPRETRVWTTD